MIMAASVRVAQAWRGWSENGTDYVCKAPWPQRWWLKITKESGDEMMRKSAVLEKLADDMESACSAIVMWDNVGMNIAIPKRNGKAPSSGVATTSNFWNMPNGVCGIPTDFRHRR